MGASPAERSYASLSFHIGRSRAHEHADTPHPVGPLRADRERPRDRRAAECGDELPPSHAGHLGVLPPHEGHGCTVGLPRTQGITERTAGPWATPEMF